MLSRIPLATRVRSAPARRSIWNATKSAVFPAFSQATPRTASSATLTKPKPPVFAELPKPVPFTFVEDTPIVSVDEKKVAIGWDTQTWSRFHHVWLRDHCRCPKCFHPVTKQRLLNTFEIPLDITPIHVESKPEGMLVSWPSTTGHQSLYPWTWLQENSYDPPLRQQAAYDNKVLWGSKIQKAPPTVTYEQVMQDDELGLFRWLSNVDKFGFSFVTGVPTTLEDTEKLSERIGFIRETQYGKFWDFTSDLSRGDTAYTTMALGAHTDNTYFTDPCGLQLFHLLEHSGGSGGATLLVDGFYVASILKELHPEAYDILSRVPVSGHAGGEATNFYRPAAPSGYPVLNHDRTSDELYQVRWNNDDRSAMKRIDPALVEDWYNAIRLWHKGITSPDAEYWVQLTPGTAVVINNHRVLHGRSAFDGKRRMCGAYIGIDEYQSKLSVLTEKFCINENQERSVWSPLL
ncbi:Trimethyllysine dioxygenase [Cylindrobasidium torrendii FP15055 ss-10]|uniref:trimethyllysine dioxygenase n=1 Tax=Cylindrobasidium torrendii FP15055 ss-10 TaxID=1314674 RepID=A0A0D7BF63_9AGAR|nr:Trimethyllysine dioxygenase [Cylindrobasidium torrendii FP15055 ss-10]